MMSFKESLYQDIWVHVAGILAMGIGVFAWYNTGFAHDPTTVQLALIVTGLAVNGVKLINGGAATLRNAAIAQQIVVDQAAANAAKIVETAASVAAAKIMSSYQVAQVILPVPAAVVPPVSPVVVGTSSTSDVVHPVPPVAP